MKTKLFSLALIGLFCLTIQAQPFQREVQHNSDIYHDLNIEVIDDGSTDFIVASNIFDSTMTSSVVSLKRMDENGMIIWAKEYSDSSLQNARVFDVANMLGFVAITGSIDVGSTKRTFIAKIDAATGSVVNVNYYDIVGSSFNSTGLNIAYTDSDADNDGTTDPGFVVGGFVSNCYNLDNQCSLNMGYVLRVDEFLNVIWTTEVDSLGTSGANNDYDFINNITETNNGFFLTGSATGITQQGFERQGVLALLIDHQGNSLWDKSYIYGNSRDVSVDAYYEASTGNIYMLSNYSSMHNFGITVFDTSGNIINSLSWVINSGYLDRYGFTLKESVLSPDNLVVFGYNREEYWTNGAGDVKYGQSNVFTYEFEKATGNQVSIAYQYLNTHVEAPGDEYNFWNGQMPLIYYPDMATVLNLNSGSQDEYVTVGYQTPEGMPYTFAEITRTSDKRNMCDNMNLTLSHTSISVYEIPVSSGLVTTTEGSMNFNDTAYSYTLTNCDGTMGVEDNAIKTGGLFPNPTNGELTVFLNNNTIKSLAIYSVLGQKVKEINLNGTASTTTLNVSDLQKGVYFINIEDNLSKNQVLKFIKN